MANGDEREGESRRDEDNDDEGQTECGGGRRGLAAGCARLPDRLDCGSQEKGRGPRQRQACGNGGDHCTAGDGSKANGGEPEGIPGEQ